MRLVSLTASVVGVLLLAGTATTQACSTLAVTATKDTLSFKLSGAAKNAPALAFVGAEAGSTKFSFGPLGTLELGIAMPLVPVFLGRTDATGTASSSLRLPPRLPKIDLLGQGTSVEFVTRKGPPSLKFCTSDVEKFSIGS